ncbi:MAG: tryptophanase [Bacteroidales bacterium]|nr:tryptophanase [Bacteroidales bacterium]
MSLPFAEPYKIKMVESIHRSTLKERTQWIKDANYNLFNLLSNQVYIDLLTDSGTGAMSDKQWSAIMSGDESYAGSRSYTELKDAVADIFGMPFFLPTHQGRAAENVLFSALVKENDIVPGNAHFDTTKGHIEFRKAQAIDCTIAAAYDTHIDHPFKGNLDLEKLEQVITEHGAKNIPFIVVTITCNTAGGLPVSIENMKEVKQLAEKHNIPVLIDSARFAENAYFIKERESGYKDITIIEIIREMFSYADMMTISAKKDGIVNIGGFIGMKDEDVFKKSTVFNILFEGFITYGGMAGRDMAALAQGLYESTDYHYLESRIKQVAYLGSLLSDAGVPVQKPFGGHAIFLNALEFLPNIKREEYPAQTLAIELYKEAGIRGVEIGTIMADRDPVSRTNRYPNLELVRLAIPRRVYTNNHMNYIAAAAIRVWERKDEIKRGYEITEEAPIMRHFTVKLRPLS